MDAKKVQPTNKYYFSERLKRQLILDTSKKTGGNIPYMLPNVYYLEFPAIARYNNGDHLEAQEYLKQAFAAALPDKDGICAILKIGRRPACKGPLKRKGDCRQVVYIRSNCQNNT